MKVVMGVKTGFKRMVRFVTDRTLTVVMTILVVGGGGAVFAALDAPAPPTNPASQSYTLTDLCNRLTAGTAGSLQSTFDEPPTGVSDTMCTLTTALGLAPVVNDAACAATTNVLTGKTFWGLCSGAGWGLKTGTATILGPPALVPKTGQTTSYATGDDGDLERGVTWPSPRFTDNSNGTVTDNLTGLIWLKNANCYGTRTWALALTDSNALANGTCSLTDGSTAGQWRLPQIYELESLVDYSKAAGPTLPTGHPFTSVQSSYYWSSTTYSPNTSNAWDVGLNVGNANATVKTTSEYVWPVR